ncbi:uracil-DNA glycosylase [candidate division WWE3 bacterium]|nr:uracil-DNA glycosylase [candidate division WWE3 bacterium]
MEVMEKITAKVEKCEKCRLCKEAKNAVPGEGDINADIVFIGEAPGANEDKTGRPFVGRAGQLLESLLGEIGLSREEVWIGNIIKHRPPKNRDPKPDEIAACEPYLTVQLRTIRPKLIVTLGRFAMYYFHKGGKISRDRGNLIKVDSKKVGSVLNVYPVYHPAAGLRNGRFREALEEDFMRIPQILKEIELEQVQNKNSSTYREEEQKGQIKLDL